MQYTKISPAIKRNLVTLLEKFPLVPTIAQEVHKNGGRIFLVGGAVRDLLLDIPVKDVDLEVHGIAMPKLEMILKQFGSVDYVGKAFGVFKFFQANGIAIDISLPRTDSAGRKPVVQIDPFISLEDAFRRRDVTINAMGIDLITDELIDPFGGYTDLQNKRLRATDLTLFVEDPLRFYRVMQFIGRFAMEPDEQLNQLCAHMDLHMVSIERIEKEFEKLLLKSVSPSRAIRWLKTINRLHDLFPEIYALIGVAQEPKWHPEGDVFEHSMQTLDAAAGFEYDDDAQKLIVMYAALCHDLGKVTTTRILAGKIISYGHETESARFAKQLLRRITGKLVVIDTVIKLVACHMQPLQFIACGAKPAAYKRLAHRLAPQATIATLALLARADRLGRNPVGHAPLTIAEPDVDLFIQKAQLADVLTQAEAPVLLGRDLIDLVEPGPRMGRLLQRAYEIQIEEGIKDKDVLKERVLHKKV